jgi:hypothetical protein
VNVSSTLFDVSQREEDPAGRVREEDRLDLELEAAVPGHTIIKDARIRKGPELKSELLDTILQTGMRITVYEERLVNGHRRARIGPDRWMTLTSSGGIELAVPSTDPRAAAVGGGGTTSVNGLAVGGKVTWDGEHALIPRGEVGEIIEVRADGKRVVHFARATKPIRPAKLTPVDTTYNPLSSHHAAGYTDGIRTSGAAAAAAAPPPAPRFVHIDPRDKSESPYSAEDNATIAAARAAGSNAVRINDVVLPTGRVLRFEVRFGANAGSPKTAKMWPNGSPTGMAQVNIDDGNTRLVKEKTRLLDASAAAVTTEALAVVPSAAVATAAAAATVALPRVQPLPLPPIGSSYTLIKPALMREGPSLQDKRTGRILQPGMTVVVHDARWEPNVGGHMRARISAGPWATPDGFQGEGSRGQWITLTTSDGEDLAVPTTDPRAVAMPRYRGGGPFPLGCVVLIQLCLFLGLGYLLPKLLYELGLQELGFLSLMVSFGLCSVCICIAPFNFANVCENRPEEVWVVPCLRGCIE